MPEEALNAVKETVKSARRVSFGHASTKRIQPKRTPCGCRRSGMSASIAIPSSLSGEPAGKCEFPGRSSDVESLDNVPASRKYAMRTSMMRGLVGIECGNG